MERIMDLILAAIHKMDGWQVTIIICFVAACLTLAKPDSIIRGLGKLLRFPLTCIGKIKSNGKQ